MHLLYATYTNGKPKSLKMNFVCVIMCYILGRWTKKLAWHISFSIIRFFLNFNSSSACYDFSIQTLFAFLMSGLQPLQELLSELGITCATVHLHSTWVRRIFLTINLLVRTMISPMRINSPLYYQDCHGSCK